MIKASRCAAAGFALLLALAGCSTGSSTSSFQKLSTRYDDDITALNHVIDQEEPNLSELVSGCARAAGDARDLAHELSSTSWPRAAKGVAAALGDLTSQQADALEACARDGSVGAVQSDLGNYPDSDAQEKAMRDALGISPPLS